MATKKTFEMVAKVLRTVRANGGDASTLNTVAGAFATAFSEENPRFDVGRFLAASKPVTRAEGRFVGMVLGEK